MAGKFGPDLHVDGLLTLLDSSCCRCGMLSVLFDVDESPDTDQGYMPLFLPPPPNTRMATGTGAAPPMPQQ